ncbi:Extracellular serine protease precursor [compost metagenome]
MIGTSLAAPKVSAAAALLIAEGREKGVRMTPDKVKQTLFKSATDYGIAGPDPDFGVGVVNVRKALKSVSR